MSVDALRHHAAADHPYDIDSMREDFGRPTEWSPDMLALFIRNACFLGRAERVVAETIDNPTVASLDPTSKTLLLQNLFESGNGLLVAEGRIDAAPGEDASDATAYEAACLLQAGQAEESARRLLALIRRARSRPPNSLHLRLLVEAYVEATGTRDAAGLIADFRKARLGVPDAYLSYEGFRRAPDPAEAARLPSPSSVALRRTKHIGTPVFWGGGRAATPAELASGGFAPPPALDSVDLAVRVGAVVDAVASIARDEQDVARALEALAAIRATHGAGAGGPVQVISTGRAGTTALFDFLEGTRYRAYHSYAWVTAPRHRWSMARLLLAGAGGSDGLREALRGPVRMLLFARLGEWAAAYRRGATPVMVSHWDAVFAPVVAGLFPGARFVHLKRGPRAVIRSMIGKRQYGGTQIAAFPSREDGTGTTIFDVAGLGRDLPDHVAWYLTFTDRLWAALQGASAGRSFTCGPAIESERLFAGEEAALMRLVAEAFPDSGRGVDDARRHFSRKINEKPAHKGGDSQRTIEMEASAIAAYESAQ